MVCSFSSTIPPVCNFQPRYIHSNERTKWADRRRIRLARNLYRVRGVIFHIIAIYLMTSSRQPADQLEVAHRMPNEVENTCRCSFFFSKSIFFFFDSLQRGTRQRCACAGPPASHTCRFKYRLSHRPHEDMVQPFGHPIYLTLSDLRYVANSSKL